MKIVLVLAVGLAFGLTQAQEVDTAQEKKDRIEVYLTIEKRDETDPVTWQDLETVIENCIAQCKEGGENSPNFFQETKEQFGQIIQQLERMAVAATWHLSIDSTYEEEEIAEDGN